MVAAPLLLGRLFGALLGLVAGALPLLGRGVSSLPPADQHSISSFHLEQGIQGSELYILAIKCCSWLPHPAAGQTPWSSMPTGHTSTWCNCNHNSLTGQGVMMASYTPPGWRCTCRAGAACRLTGPQAAPALTRVLMWNHLRHQVFELYSRLRTAARTGLCTALISEVSAKKRHYLSKLASTGMLWPSAATGRIDGSSAMISFAAARAFDGSPPSRCASCTQHAVVGRPAIIQGRTRVALQCGMPLCPHCSTSLLRILEFTASNS